MESLVAPPTADGRARVEGPSGGDGVKPKTTLSRLPPGSLLSIKHTPTRVLPLYLLPSTTDHKLSRLRLCVRSSQRQAACRTPPLTRPRALPPARAKRGSQWKGIMAATPAAAAAVCCPLVPALGVTAAGVSTRLFSAEARSEEKSQVVRRASSRVGLETPRRVRATPWYLDGASVGPRAPWGELATALRGVLRGVRERESERRGERDFPGS